MNELTLANRAADWHRMKALVLDSVSSPITKRVYNLGLDEFIEWYGQEPRPGFTRATVSAWRVALEARGLGSVSINVRITAVRKLAVEAADNGLLAPELANGIARVKGVASKGVRLGNWLSLKQAQALLNAPDITTVKGLRDRAIIAVLLRFGAVCMSVTDASSGSSRSNRPPLKGQRVSATGTSTGGPLLASAGGPGRRENSPCPGLRPGRFGFFFRSALENGAALRLSLRRSSWFCFRRSSICRCNSRIKRIRSSRLRESRSGIKHYGPIPFCGSTAFKSGCTPPSSDSR
jgi:hypothetical protein